jgi:hypothetical protein
VPNRFFCQTFVPALLESLISQPAFSTEVFLRMILPPPANTLSLQGKYLVIMPATWRITPLTVGVE